jgi:arylsulfatase A-like enzyme
MGNNGTLNGFKSSLWEGGHRVPAIAWYPGKIKPGKIAHDAVISMDVLPTLLSIAGISKKNRFDGTDFSKLLFSEKEMKKRPLFWRYQNQWVVRIENWKYLKIKDKEYLFDLNNDLGETTNLKDENPVMMQKFKNLIKNWEKEMEDYAQQTN